MPNSAGGMAILPQYQGDYYTLQNQQALAQALMQNALKGQAPMQTVGSGQYQVMPRVSPIAGMSQLASALLGAKMAQSSAQGMNQLGANQMGYLNSLMGGQPQGGAAVPSPQPDASSGDAGTGDAATVGATSAAAPVSSGSGSVPGVNGNASSPLNPLGMDPRMAAMYYMADPAKYMETQSAAYKPAEIVAQLRAAGIDPNSGLGHQLAQNMLAKAVAPDYVSLRPGGYSLNKSTGEIQQMPQVPEGYTAVQGQNGWQIVPVQGGLNAMSNSAAAKAGGQAQYQLQDVWDPTANNGQGGFVKQSVANVANAANGAGNPGMPLPLRNNNPGAVSPGGKVANYPDLQTGLTAMDKNLASYAGQPNTGTLAGVITKWVGSPPNAPAYIKDVSTRLGIPPNAPVDLTNPAQRQAISTAIMLHENGPSAVFGGGKSVAGAPAQSSQGGPMASQPPLGQTANANTAQEAGAQTMHDSYKKLQDTTATSNAALEALQKMQSLAAKKIGLLTAGPLGTNVAPVVSPEAAEYEKQRANVITLLANQNGTNGSDAGRALTGDSVPDYGKPKAAISDGLQTLINQTRAQQLKGQFLTPAYNAGDSKTYTRLENEFDRNVSPAMIPLLTMQPGRQRADALKAARKDPAMNARLEWAVQNGLIK